MKTINHETPTKPNTDTLNDHVENLRRDAGTLANDVKEHASAKVNEVKDQAVAKYQDAKDQASSKLQDVKEQASARFQDAKDLATDAFGSTRSFVKEHPFTALGVGVLLGIVLASRWGKKDA